MSKAAVVLLLLVTACTGTAQTEGTVEDTDAGTTTSTEPADQPYPPRPEVPTGPLDPTTAEGVEELLGSIYSGDFDGAQTVKITQGGDVRAAWIVADLLRFFQSGPPRDELVFTFSELTGVPWEPGKVDFVWAFDLLMAWDLPAWDQYSEVKAALYTRVQPSWQKFFDEDVSVDWRHVTWGGVLADERPFDDNGPCNCIPSLDNPLTTPAEGGAWYPDERIVFGVVVSGEALALPKHQMEIHEMLNLTLGGRDLGIPYCTLCGSAQAYFTDTLDERVVLRTSGLLSRSNKMMYDLPTGSLIDTFTGKATSGPLAEAGVVLEQTTVVASTWGDWKAAHPDTQILAQDGGIGRVYSFDPLGNRDANGPIFPIGEVDERLSVQENVVGVVTPDGMALAIPVEAAKSSLGPGDETEYQGVTIRFDDAIRVFDGDGNELATHQAFWFAWSQFHPDTLLWPEQP